MNTNKIITEFQEMSSTLSKYETERNNLLTKVKILEKENKKWIEKIKKETDPVLKSLYQSKLTMNTYFIDEIYSIFSFPKKVEK